MLGHPVALVIAIALFVRAGLATAVNLLFGGALFQDDGTYHLLASDLALGTTARWTDYEHFLVDATATLLLPLSWLYAVLGPHILIGQLLVAAFAAVAAGCTVRLALEALPVRYAVAAGLVVALLPSQVLFSSTIFKDPPVWACLAGLGLTMALLGRSRGWRTALLLLVLTVILLLLAHLRLHTLIAAAWAAVLASSVSPAPGQLRRTGAVLLLALALPLQLGIGLGGYSLITQGQSLEQRRLANAAGAATAFVTPSPAPARTPMPGGGPGGGQTEAPAPTAAEPPAPSAGGRTLPALGRGLSVMILEPYPTSGTFANSRLTAALAENVLWWPLLALALLGTKDAWRHRRVLAFPVIVGGAIVLLYALAEGNFGTAYRHRGEVVWVVALLAAFGVRRIITRLRRGST